MQTLALLSFFVSTCLLPCLLHCLLSLSYAQNSPLDNLHANFDNDISIENYNENSLDFSLRKSTLSSGKVQKYNDVYDTSDFSSERSLRLLKQVDKQFYKLLSKRDIDTIYVNRIAFLIKGVKIDQINKKNLLSYDYITAATPGMKVITIENLIQRGLLNSDPSTIANLDFQFLMHQPLPLISGISSKVNVSIAPMSDFTSEQQSAITNISKELGIDKNPDRVVIDTIITPKYYSEDGEYNLLGEDHPYVKGNASFIFFYQLTNGNDILVVHNRISIFKKPYFIPSILFNKTIFLTYDKGFKDFVSGVRNYFSN
ncbi:MAG: hypothetical protein HQK49_16940 [Oligoflexia bacterium]|nr:hypothetical protein [Oligoflexia bacterium]